MLTKTKTTTKRPAVTKRKPLITLTRFTVDAQLADNHVCGRGNEQRFTAEMKLTAQDLDDQGFVVNNREFIEHVRSAFHGMHTASCEQLAEGLINLAVTNISIRLTKASARVYNETGWVDVAWERGQTVPSFPLHSTADEVLATNRRKGIGAAPYNC
jgi:dihydroneopterin aldolase